MFNQLADLAVHALEDGFLLILGSGRVEGMWGWFTALGGVRMRGSGWIIVAGDSVRGVKGL